MRVSRLSRRHILLALLAAVVVFPLLLAAFAPILAPIPEARAGWVAPPLPNRDEPLPGFQDLLEPLPIVVRDLPDEFSNLMVSHYEDTAFTDEWTALNMLSAAQYAIPVPTELQNTWIDWIDSDDFGDVPPAVIAALENDPLNGDRLSNLAVAMFLYDFTGTFDAPTQSHISYSRRSAKAILILDAAASTFPQSRAATLNYMFFNAHRTGATPNRDAIQANFEELIASEPEDTTALSLAVRIYVNGLIWQYESDSARFQEFAVALTENKDARVAAFGHALLGDLALGPLRLGEHDEVSNIDASPYLTAHNARVALEHYDAALELTDDPSVYSARAFALSILGDIPGAIASQQRAVELAPDSPSLKLLLADLHLGQGETIEDRRSAIEDARAIERDALAFSLAQPEPLIKDVAILASTRERVPLVSNQVERFGVYYEPPSGGRGGGFIVSFQLIEQYGDAPSEAGSTPIDQAILGVLAKSEALADPDGFMRDLDTYNQAQATPEWLVPLLGRDPIVAVLVGKADTISPNDLPSSEHILRAAGWLRFIGDPNTALSLCQSGLEVPAALTYDSPFLHNCVGTNAYLIGDYETAVQAFDAMDNDLLVGYTAERMGDFDEAELRYLHALEGDEKYKAMIRLADLLLATGKPDHAIAVYDEWITWVGEWECYTGSCLYEGSLLLPQAYSNRGIARLQMLGDRNGNIDCSGDDRNECLTAANDFDAALGYDAYNPVFLMNRAWVARLLGDNDLSSELMLRAVESDPSLYPVLNDLGVFAANNGNTDEAKQYLLDAVAANPQYALGWWNLGVLEMRKGPRGIIRGQAYLARAIARDPSLVTSSMNFKTDESIYRVEFSEEAQPGAGWSFATASSLATTAFGFLAAAFIVFQATTHVLKDQLVEFIAGKVDSARPWIEKHIKPIQARLQEHSSAAWLLFILTILVMIISGIIPAWRGDPVAASASITLALFALVLAVGTHELGHRVSARMMNAQLEPVQWAPGIGLSLFLLPFNVSSGPFPAQRVNTDDDTDKLWVYLFGPLANLGMALGMYAVYVIQPVPILRLIAITQLAVMSYSLLPFDPLDGAPLSKAQPKLVSGLAGFALLAGVLLSVGIL